MEWISWLWYCSRCFFQINVSTVAKRVGEERLSMQTYERILYNNAPEILFYSSKIKVMKE